MLDTRFWEEGAGALADVCSRDWTWVEPYRGANANMHGVEAMVAAGDRCGASARGASPSGSSARRA